jgi:hypothetical protein
MKFITALALLLTFSTAASAQSALDQQIELARQTAQTDRQVILKGNMDFTADESEAFWPVWKEYRTAASANSDRMLNLIRDFAENYNEIPAHKANELMTDYFSIKMQALVVKQQFGQKISQILPAQKAMRVIQIENKLDAAIDMQLASEIPLAR